MRRGVVGLVGLRLALWAFLVVALVFVAEASATNPVAAGAAAGVARAAAAGAGVAGAGAAAVAGACAWAVADIAEASSTIRSLFIRNGPQVT